MNIRRFVSACALLLLAVPLLAVPTSASARECEDVKLANSVTVEGTKLVLNGMGVREATVFSVNVYVAGLYLAEKSRSGAKVMAAAGPKRLVLRFVRDVDKDDIVEAYEDGFKGGGKASGLKKEIKQLLAWTPAAKDGRKWTYTYIPGKGTEVKIGSSVKGVIPGDGFFKAFLNIWLGSDPPNSGLKEGLLGGECG